MKTATDYLYFNTQKRRDLVNITERVAEFVKGSGIREGMVLV